MGMMKLKNSLIFNFNFASYFNKLRDTANELGLKNFFEDLELHLKQ